MTTKGGRWWSDRTHAPTGPFWRGAESMPTLILRKVGGVELKFQEPVRIIHSAIPQQVVPAWPTARQRQSGRYFTQTLRISMPRGDKTKYTDKQERKAAHIAQGYGERGTAKDEAERRAWATVNKDDGGGKIPEVPDAKNQRSARKGRRADQTATGHPPLPRSPHDRRLRKRDGRPAEERQARGSSQRQRAGLLSPGTGQSDEHGGRRCMSLSARRSGWPGRAAPPRRDLAHIDADPGVGRANQI